MVRTGFVKEKKNGQLRVCFQRPEACEGCRGCSKGLLPKTELLTVFGSAEIGDTVDVRMPEARTLKASLLVYVVPLITTIAALLIGVACRLQDQYTALLAVAGLIAGSLAVRAVEHAIRKKSDWLPTVVAVHPKANTERNE